MVVFERMKAVRREKGELSGRERLASIFFVWSSFLLISVSAQESGQPNPLQTPLQAQPVPPETANPPVASPVPEGPAAVDPRPYEPPLPEAPVTGGPAPGAPAAGTSMIPEAPSNTPAGVTVSPLKMDSRMIEVFRPERVKVFPDDPESAWWEINPHYAFDRAQREQKPLLLLFTGIWNEQAMSLSQEVFSTKSFNEFVKENLVICYLSYERNITDNHDALRKIKDKFKVKGYPNVLLFNPNGEVEKGIRGYRKGRPVDYFNRLRAACLPVLESIETQKKSLVRYGYRDWSNYRGKVIFARFMEHDGTYVRLQDASGQKWLVKLNDLAPPDQKLVESFPAVDTLTVPESKNP